MSSHSSNVSPSSQSSGGQNVGAKQATVSLQASTSEAAIVSITKSVADAVTGPSLAENQTSSIARVRLETARVDGGNIKLPAPPAYLSERAKRAASSSNDVEVIAGIQRPIGIRVAPLETLASISDSALPVLTYVSDAREQLSLAQNTAFRRRSRFHLLALCLCLFLGGWNDGSTGPLLPAIQQHYNVGFGVVSLFFVSNCVGFVTGAFVNIWLSDKFVFGKVVVVASIFPIMTYAIQSPAPPFPVLILANILGGFGIAVQNSQANGFIGSLKEHMSTKLGLIHASYGLGAFAAPLLATHFSSTRHWSFHYLVSTGLAVFNTFVLIMTFRFRAQDELLAEAGQEATETSAVRDSSYKQIIGLKAVNLLALFALIYVGVEVTLGGWIVTFIIRQRGGGPSAGYISSGFFGGLTVGRVVLMWLNRKIGEQRVIFVYVLLTIGLEVTIWVVPSMFENAIAISLIGVLLGPMFPLIVGHAARVLPQRLLTGAIGWIAGVGTSGAAVLPLMTGLLASKYGIGSLQPLLVGMMAAMVGVWACVPKGQRRID